MQEIDGLNRQRFCFLWIVTLSAAAFLLLIQSIPCFAEESLCAVVKIEIRQELTLERQAFDAHMRINNGLSHLGLEDVNISLSFADEDGEPVTATYDTNNTSASFYFREDSKTNIADISGNGTVAPSTSADVHWLIIPAPGASNGLEKGKLYTVGATLTYTLGGESKKTTVSPDTILVKPMPQMVLDYFLPMNVYGDDAFTEAVEPPIPFSLGVRVQNDGRGTARDLKIESAQPKITENEQGLLIGFTLHGSRVNGNPAEKTLMANFGDIGPGDSATARWLMECSLSGRFVEFGADLSHSDELGGSLTSLINDVQTHVLVRDVKVDLVGRDTVLDFLAKDGDRHRVYESDGMDTLVDDLSTVSALSYVETTNRVHVYSLTSPARQGFVYMQLPDPFLGSKRVHSAIRSDGKVIKPENIWFSKSRENKDWKYFIHLFDVGTTGTYTIRCKEPAAKQAAPVLQFIADAIAVEGEPVSFVVRASDPDGTIPAVSASGLPAGSSLTDASNGTAIFDWPTALGQAGTYFITFSASDGNHEDSQRVAIVVRSITDTDGDDMNDEWEMHHFGTLDRNGSQDFDHDNVSDRDEFLAGSDPTATDHAPSTPTLLFPTSGHLLSVSMPDLEIENSIDLNGDKIEYQFELYADEQLTSLVMAAYDVPESTNTTRWSIPIELNENHHYFWRVRAADGYSCSLWAYGDFVVNATNEPPGGATPSFPPDGSEVDSVSPVLQVTGISDPDQETLFCSFEVYEDAAMGTLVSDEHGIVVAEDGRVSWRTDASLNDGEMYFWRAIVADNQGLEIETPLSTFVVNTTNHAPAMPTISSPFNGEDISALQAELVAENALDLDGDTLFYTFEIDPSPCFDDETKRISVLMGEGIGTTSWQVKGLQENRTYYWRVRSTDTEAYSPWATADFWVNVENDRPGRPTVKNPGNDAWVGVNTPDLCITDGKDPDGDPLSYRFEVYSDLSLNDLVAWGETFSPSWTVPTELADQTHYYWRARSIDEHGLAGNWMPTAAFYVNEEEPTSPEEIKVQVCTNKGQVIRDIHVYAFTSSGSYAGVRTTTGLEGAAIFDMDALFPGVYRFRADYLGGRFWSEEVTLPGTAVATITIEEENVTVTSETAAGAFSGARVYLFSESGSYLGTYQETDANGQAFFTLPAGKTFLFRTDILGSRYWSEKTTVTAGGDNHTVIDVGGGRLQLTVLQNETDPLPGIKTHLFTESGRYTGVSDTTNALGTVEYDVTEANYDVRVDYLGYKFWTDPIDVTSDTIQTMVIDHADLHLTVLGRFQDRHTPIEKAKCYLFTSGGKYLGQYQTTDMEGQALFDLPEREFKIRADVLGGHYWTEPFVWQDPEISIPMADAHVTVSGAGLAKEGVRVYVFSSSGSYLGVKGMTTSDGAVHFRLPERAYDFRADYQGSQFWARNQHLASDEMTDIGISVGGGTFRLVVQDDLEAPLAGIKCHVFNEKDAYLGLTGITDESGKVGFELSDGTYRFRVDYLGSSFWQEDIQLSGDRESVLVIPHQPVTLTTIGAYLEEETPFATVPVYLFSPAGAYLGRSQKTDETGQVTFDLPEKSFMARVDAMGERFWSQPFSWNDPRIQIDQGQAIVRVLRSSEPVAQARIHLFSKTDRYLGRFEVTGTDGNARFVLPEGQYRFRIDTTGQRQWTDIIEIKAHAEILEEVEME